jgi:hypothetical protein|tara:strand:+ start:6549 stop:7481 length:933 start_codon:yes stop_codon:yes gene_type:complete
MNFIKKLIMEVLNEEQLDEKLITYNNRKPYGQVVFLVGGAGSGKGFAGSNFLDSAGFKVRDVDEMKKQLQVLNRMGKITVADILKKHGNKIKPANLELINKVFNTELPRGGRQTIRNLNLKDPDHVATLHYLVKAMGIKDKSLINMLSASNNSETLPNIMFDITAKDLSDITDILPLLKNTGYSPKNVHLTWILTNYVTAMENNKGRERMVPEDTLLKTHEGASNTIWSLLTRALPKSMDGRADVILNNPQHTVFHKDSDGKTIKGAVKGFLTLPIKKAGGGIFPEKVWKTQLFNWIKDNAPDAITKNMK